MPTPAHDFSRSVIEEFRAHRGKVGGPFEGEDLLLLTTTGARSGAGHTTPLGYVRHDGALLIVGSNLGADRHPAWYHNLLAHPQVSVELGGDTFEALAIPAEGARRAELFETVVRAVPGYADYQARTARPLPVVRLEPTEPTEPAGPDGRQAPAPVTTLAGKLLEVHTWLRAQLRHVGAETEAHFAARAAHTGPGGPPAPGLGLQIRQRCLAFCQGLEFHHTSEDAHLFPGIAAHHPHLAATFERLREEHRTVARIQTELASLLGEVAITEPERFRAGLARMTAELTAHLDFEEEVLLPLLEEVPWPPPRP
ncbi:nitroreductase/quinone reductase family protein [Streptomyces sp. NPDC012794]|uniref:nitroreductase/quinone reductase family protein n=1 Tax=Streptomyces sp. NPDC012794 TaxID=3364850 RepID=UPI0036A4D2A6